MKIYVRKLISYIGGLAQEIPSSFKWSIFGFFFHPEPYSVIFGIRPFAHSGTHFNHDNPKDRTDPSSHYLTLLSI